LGLIPDSLKIAKNPIFNSGPKNLISNYRPISVLANFYKILEMLMATRLSTYLDPFALLSPAQFGYPVILFEPELPILNGILLFV